MGHDFEDRNTEWFWSDWIINEKERVTPTSLAPSKTCSETFSHNPKVFRKTSGRKNDLISYSNFRGRIQSTLIFIGNSKKSIHGPQLWLVFPELQCIEIFFCENGRLYYLHSSTNLFPPESESKFLKDWVLILDVLFPNVIF